MKKIYFLLCLLTLSFTATVGQTTFTVSSDNDDGPGSLRVAITSINSSTATGPFTITCTTAGPISLTAALPDITKSCSIIGVNATRTIIERSSSALTRFRIFTLPSTTNNIHLQWLTMRNGYAPGVSDGGGILTQGNLVVDQCLVTQNRTNNQNGGGIYNLNGSVTVVTSTISSNTGSFGGGLSQFTGGTLVVANSTIENNTGNIAAGGIASIAETSPASVVVVNSLIRNNTTSAGSGGGIGIDAIPATYPSSLTLINSTLSRNTGTTASCEVQIVRTSTAYIDHCTITGSSVYTSVISSGTIIIQNTVVANSVGSAISTYSLGVITSLGHNLATDNPASFTATGDQTNTDPLLLPLADNGGPTLTHALSCHSPAINAGIASETTADQRGLPYLGTPDVGAYEFQTTPLSVSISASNSGTLTCANPSLLLTASITNGSSVTYTFQGAGLSGTPTSSSTTSVSAVGTYTVTAQSAEGCTASATITVSSNTATPGVSLTVSNNGVLLCSTPVLTLSASSPTIGTSFSFAGPVITNTAPSAISLNGQGTYSVTATNPVNGCISSTTASVISSTETPVTSLTATNAGILTCSVQTLTLTASSSTSGVSYSFTSVNSFTLAGNSIVVNLAGAYSVMATAPNGCTVSETVTIGQDLSIPVFTVSSVSVCATQQATLQASGCSGGVVRWPNGVTGSTFMPSANTTTLITATCTIGTCSTTASGSVVVGAGAPPSAAVLSLTANESACPVRLIGRAIGTAFVYTGPNGYVFSSVYRTGGTYDVFGEAVKQPGVYTLTVTYTNECGSSPAVSRSVTVSRSCP